MYPYFSSPISFVLFDDVNPLLMQLSFPPMCLLYSTTLQKTAEPTFRFGLFLLVAPSNYRPPNVASNGAPISTINV